MIQIEMSKDINDFSPKIISVFDKRQLICTAIASTYGIPIMLYADFLDIQTRIMAAVILMSPVLMCGWVKMYGMYLEKFVLHILRTRVFNRTTRYYETENTFGYLDHTVKAPKKPAMEKPVKRKWKAKKKYKKDMAEYEGRR